MVQVKGNRWLFISQAGSLMKQRATIVTAVVVDGKQPCESGTDMVVFLKSLLGRILVKMTYLRPTMQNKWQISQSVSLYQNLE
jgi:hypothetical protein